MRDDPMLTGRLRRPEKIADVVLDTDTYNEIDDQYALAYLLLSGGRLRTRAVHAAPFLNEKSESPKDGMEKSYNEILKVIGLCGMPELSASVFRGSEKFLPDEKTPVASDAAENLIKLAAEHTPEDPLYVVTIGAVTNVASAIIVEPGVADSIVIVSLIGQPHHWPPVPEFNMMQDIAAGRVIFGSGAPFVQLPCAGVVTHLATTEPELRHHIKGKSALGDYLYEITCKEALSYGGNAAWSRVIWDVSAVAWLLSEDFVSDMLVPAPLPGYEHGYVHDPRGRLMKVAYYVDRDAIFADLFTKIAAAGR